MKKSDKTALTAAAFAAALNIVPMGAAAYDPAEEEIQDVYGPPAYFSTTTTAPQPVYGPPEIMSSLYPELFTTTASSLSTEDITPQPEYGPPPVVSSTENQSATTTTTATFPEDNIPQPVYGPMPIYGDLTYDGVVDSYDLIAMRQMFRGGVNAGDNYYIADLNNDGSVSVSDLVVLSRYVLGSVKNIGVNYDYSSAPDAEDPVTTTKTEFYGVYGPPAWFGKETE